MSGKGQFKRETWSLACAFVSSDAGDITCPHEVVLQADGTIQRRTNGTDIPIGMAFNGGSNGDEITVDTILHNTDLANVLAATDAGVLLRPNGTLVDINGVQSMQYVPAVAGELAIAISLEQVAGAGNIRVGQLRAPIRVV